MTSIRPPHHETTIDECILAFRHTHRRIMFSDLADRLPTHTWHALFSALGRLSREQRIELVAHRWDCEVVFLPQPTRPAGSRSSLQRGSGREARERRRL